MYFIESEENDIWMYKVNQPTSSDPPPPWDEPEVVVISTRIAFLREAIWAKKNS